MYWPVWVGWCGAALLVLGGLLAPAAAAAVRAPSWRRASRFSAVLGALACAAGAAGVWALTGRPPAGSAAETLLILAPAMALAYALTEGLAKSREAGLPALLTAAGLYLAGLAAAPHPALAGRLPAGLASPWLPFCLVSGLVAYGLLFTAAIQAATLLAVRELWPARAERAGRAVYWSVCLGLPPLLWSMMGAAAWSQSVRGTIWSWTGRETWALIYALLLAAYLHLQFMAGWRERRAAWFLLAASLAGLVSFGALGSFPAPGGDRGIADRPAAAAPARPARARGDD